MKNLIIIMSYIVFINAQSQSWNWVRHFGGPKADKAIITKVDHEDNIIVAGYYTLSMYMGNGWTIGTNNNSKQIYVAKYDKYGQCLWIKDGGNGLDDRILGMDIDPKGNIYVVGTCWSTFGTFPGYVAQVPSIFVGGSDQGYIIKLDKDGNFKYLNAIGSLLPHPQSGNSGDDHILDVIADEMGNCYCVGFVSGNQVHLGAQANGLNFMVPNLGKNVCNYYLAKIDTAGKWKWGFAFGNLPKQIFPTGYIKYMERDLAIAIDSNKHIYITGGFDSTRIFGKDTLKTFGGTDVFIMKVDTGGKIIYTKQGGSNDDDWSNGITTDGMGNLYVTGEHRDSFYFDSMLIRNYKKRDVFVAKLDCNTGKGIWGRRAGGDLGGERGNGVYADKNCRLYVCGEVMAGAKFGKFDIDTNGFMRIFVARMDPRDGDFMWVTTTSSPNDSDCRASSIAVGSNKSLYVCGFFEKPTTFGSTVKTSYGSGDAFLLKLTDMSPIDSCYKLGIKDTTNKPWEEIFDTVVIDSVDYIEPGASLSDKSGTIKIAIYPNPVSDILFVECEFSIQSTLFNIIGESIIQSNEKSIDMKDMPNGIYMLKLTTEDGRVKNIRIVKK
jgi:hypothetical protein